MAKGNIKDKIVPDPLPVEAVDYTELLNSAAGIQRMVAPFSRAVEVLQTVMQLERKIDLLEGTRDDLLEKLQELTEEREKASLSLAQGLKEIGEKRAKAEIEAQESIQRILVSKDREIKVKEDQLKALDSSIKTAQDNYTLELARINNGTKEALRDLELVKREYEEFVAKFSK
jgi:hypothetical protein